MTAATHANVDNDLLNQIAQLKADLNSLETEFRGNPAKNEIGEKNDPILSERLFALNRGISRSTYGPTATHKQTMEMIKKELGELNEKLSTLKTKASELAGQVSAAGGSWIEGQD